MKINTRVNFLFPALLIALLQSFFGWGISMFAPRSATGPSVGEQLWLSLGLLSTLPAVLMAFVNPIYGGCWLIIGSVVSFGLLLTDSANAQSRGVLFALQFLPMFLIGVWGAVGFRSELLSSETRYRWLFRSAAALGVINFAFGCVFSDYNNGFSSVDWALLLFLPAILLTKVSRALGMNISLFLGLIAPLSFATSGIDLAGLLFALTYVTIPSAILYISELQVRGGDSPSVQNGKST